MWLLHRVLKHCHTPSLSATSSFTSCTVVFCCSSIECDAPPLQLTMTRILVPCVGGVWNKGGCVLLGVNVKL